jgi:hypothetical protein
MRNDQYFIIRDSRLKRSLTNKQNIDNFGHYFSKSRSLLGSEIFHSDPKRNNS